MSVCCVRLNRKVSSWVSPVFRGFSPSPRPGEGERLLDLHLGTPTQARLKNHSASPGWAPVPGKAPAPCPFPFPSPGETVRENEIAGQEKCRDVSPRMGAVRAHLVSGVLQPLQSLDETHKGGTLISELTQEVRMLLYGNEADAGQLLAPPALSMDLFFTLSFPVGSLLLFCLFVLRQGPIPCSPNWSGTLYVE